MKSSSFVAVVCLFLLVFSNVATYAASPPDVEPLFFDAEPGLQKIISSDLAAASISPDTTIRGRNVFVSLPSLGSHNNPAPSIQLNLFDDAEYTAIYQRSEENASGFAWIGHIEGIALSQVVLIISENAVTGSVSMPGASYTIKAIDGSLHMIEQTDHSQFPPELEPIPAPQDQFDTMPKTMTDAGDDPCTDITVLVAYSPEARLAEGGTANMMAQIHLAVAETNQSYINSGIQQRIRLVHTMETAPGDASNDFSSDLGALQNLGDGKFTAVDAARNEYYADLVALIIDGSSSCGIAYVGSSATYAFSVIDRDCATGYYSFGHELGHNMGARHDWYVDEFDSYAKGFVNPADKWRTVMAYNDLCFDSGANCVRLQYWSNPGVFQGSDAMGVANGTSRTCREDSLDPDPASCDADNHIMLNSTCSNIANFRNSPASADLTLLSSGVDDKKLTPGQSFTFSTIVKNLGNAASLPTTLHYYLSSDANINTSDTEIGSTPVASLSASATSYKNIALTAPDTNGTYYVGACVDEAGETVTSNNCSTGVPIAVSTSFPPNTSSFPWSLYLPNMIRGNGR